MRRSETNTFLSESESGNKCPFAWVGWELFYLSMCFILSMCYTKACSVFARGVCSPNYYCCPEQLSSCIVSLQDHTDMGWKGSLEVIWSSLCLQVQDCCQHQLRSTLIFSSALENLHVTHSLSGQMTRVLPFK